MSDPAPDTADGCESGQCASYHAGHSIHFIQARKVGESPWGWRDGVVIGVDGLDATVAYLGEDATPSVWHHRSLSLYVEVGDPVRLHEQYGVLGCPSGWFSVAITGGLGPVAQPDAPGLWIAETTVGVVDLATGIAIATDHRPRD
jgi:hypothetical protein